MSEFKVLKLIKMLINQIKLIINIKALAKDKNGYDIYNFNI
jgi:hypothetical protein